MYTYTISALLYKPQRNLGNIIYDNLDIDIDMLYTFNISYDDISEVISRYLHSKYYE